MFYVNKLFRRIYVFSFFYKKDRRSPYMSRKLYLNVVLSFMFFIQFFSLEMAAAYQQHLRNRSRAVRWVRPSETGPLCSTKCLIKSAM